MTGNEILEIALANPDVIVPLDELITPAKRNKYGNVKCEFDGLRFASKAEMARYGDLRLLQMTGAISNLTTQPVFELAGKVKYRGDFQYTENGRTIVEDVKGGKGTQTAAFRIKWKQTIERYPDIEFRVIVQ